MASPTPSQPDTVASTSTSNSSESDFETSSPLNTKCNLCNETFTIPKVLNCFHSFCQPCLEKIIDVPDKVICPDCRQETFLSTSGASGLLPDFAISNILEASAMENTSLNCTGCKSKDSNAVARCFDCANFLCPNCVMAHQFMHCFEGHRVLTLNELQNSKEDIRIEKPISCSRHKTDVLKYFCRTCNIPICKECTMVEHSKGHEYEYVSEVGSMEIDSIQQLAESSKVKANELRGTAKSIEHSSNRLQIQYHKAQNEINDTYNFYRSMLEERKQEALKELDGAYNSKQVSLSAVAQKMQDSIEKLYQGCEFIEKLTKYATTTEILLFKKMLLSKLNSLLSYVPELNNPGNFDIEFISNYQAIQVGIRNTFGYIRQSPETQPNKQQPIARPNGFTSTRTNGVPNGMPNGMPNGHVSFESGLNGLSGSGLNGSGLNGGLNSGLNGGMNGGLNGSLNVNGSISSGFLNSKQQFPSTTSLNMPTQPDPIISTTNNTNMYEKWSNGGLDILQNGDVFSTSSDPVIDLTSKLITANIYPPKSQIKRQKMIYHCKFGEFGVMEGQFTEPSGVAVNAQNDIIVADTNNHRIQIFDKEGRFKFQFGECGKRDGQLLYPNRVAVVKPSGDIVVTERSPTHQIQIYNQYGQFVRKFGANILQHPRGVTVDNKGRIIIVECKVMRVIIFDQLGNVLQKFGCSKHLEFPNGVVVNDKEEIFISDNRAHCVKVFNYQGVFLQQIGGEGITNYPIGVGINRAGEILIADNHNNFNLTIFTQEGQLISALESKVKHAQCFDVALMDDGSIVLASKDYRLYIYRYLQLPSLGM